MARPIRKYIMIPEYRPLFAMQECFGPQHGPLREPCPTPIPVIGKLLRQDGENKLTIYEVLKNADRTFSAPVLLTLDNYTLPYDEILGGKKVDPGPALEPMKNEAKAVAPVIGNFASAAPAPEPEPPKEPEPEETVPVEDTPVPEEPTEQSDETAEPQDAVVPDEAVKDDGDATEEGSDESPEPADVPQDEEAEDSAVSATVENETPELPPEPEVTVTSGSGVEVEEISPKVKPYAQMSKKERKEAQRKAEAAKAGK